MSDEAYNPLAIDNLGKSVAEALLERSDHGIDEIPRFAGAGIYVIYYMGEFEPYRPIGEVNREELRWPIYIGKAIPQGGRKGVAATAVGNDLHGRLRQHKDSIKLAETYATETGTSNIAVADFRVRHLIVDDIWIPLGESLLISKFRPLWNGTLDGFGNHDPGSGRYQGKVPFWDILHPGRKWAFKMQPQPVTAADLAAGCAEYLRNNAPPPSPHMKFAP